MRNLFLMTMFGLFMIAASSSQSLVHLTFAASANATESNNDAKSEDKKDSKSKSKKDSKSVAKTDSKSKDKKDSKSVDKTDSKSNDDEASNNEPEFHCPEGITNCYRADGTEYIDVNNLSATAAGPGGSGGGTNNAVKPSHFRSF